MRHQSIPPSRECRDSCNCMCITYRAELGRGVLLENIVFAANFKLKLEGKNGARRMLGGNSEAMRPSHPSFRWRRTSCDFATPEWSDYMCIVYTPHSVIVWFGCMFKARVSSGERRAPCLGLLCAEFFFVSVGRWKYIWFLRCVRWCRRHRRRHQRCLLHTQNISIYQVTHWMLLRVHQMQLEKKRKERKERSKFTALCATKRIAWSNSRVGEFFRTYDFICQRFHSAHQK